MNRHITQHPEIKTSFGYFQNGKMNEIKKIKPELKELFQKYDCDIIVMGGGPSLWRDLVKLKASLDVNVIYISCNHHPLTLITLDNSDYLCFLDKLNTSYTKELTEVCKTTDAIKITKWVEYTDYYCVNENILDVGDTGIFGVWLACYLTSGTVHLCGFGLREQGKPENYGSNVIIEKSELKPKYGRWLTSWPKFYRPERIKPVSGPLVKLAKEPPYINKQLLDFPKTDKDIAVLGGSISLPDDLLKLKNNCLLMSVNHHALNYAKCDFIVFMDDVEKQKRLEEALEKTDATKIAFYNSKYTDYFSVYQSPNFPTSGHFAAWVASYITTGTIYLCGFSLYNINEPLNIGDDDKMGWGGPSEDVKVTQWKETFDLCVNKKFKAISGPLTEIL